jgi:hypothetical protein
MQTVTVALLTVAIDQSFPSDHRTLSPSVSKCSLLPRYAFHSRTIVGRITSAW